MKYKSMLRGKGDDGFTDLWKGGKVRKTDIRMDVVGDFDEFHATLGLCHPYLESNVEGFHVSKQQMLDIQGHLMSIMSEICSEPNDAQLTEFNLQYLETLANSIADHLDNETGGQTGWSLYGENGEASARFEYAATVCRRCERKLIQLDGIYTISTLSIAYMNRLSKVLFFIARYKDL
jgi:cob(I)alamin adenosyltransferase